MLYGYFGCVAALIMIFVIPDSLGAAGWRAIAVIYAVIGLIVNTISVFSVRELPENVLDETSDPAQEMKEEKYTLKDAFRLLAANKLSGIMIPDIL